MSDNVRIEELPEPECWELLDRVRFGRLARMVSSFTEIYAKDEKHLESWLPTEKPLYVEISVESISGRRFVRGEAA